MKLSFLNANFLAQLVHIFAASTAVLGAIVFGFPWWTGAVGILGVAAVKEVLIDPYDFEKNPLWTGTLNSGAFDLAMYGVGVAVTVAALFFTGRLA